MKALSLLLVCSLMIGCGSPANTAIPNQVPTERPGNPEGSAGGKAAAKAPMSNSSSSAAPAEQ